MPIISPNLTHILFNGLNIAGLSKLNNKKSADKMTKYTFINPLFLSGQKAIIKKTKANSKPKLLLELFDFI